MDTATFYATTSAVSFTLLGFWWVVVQFRHDEMTQDPGRRRLAFVVSLHFILPGLMSLGALLTADAPIVWRLTFGAAGIAGMAAVVVASRGVKEPTGAIATIGRAEWIALPLYATYMRLLRADLIATLQSDFITTARAKGLSTKRILFGHALRPSLFSLVTAAAVSTGALIGGVVIVEQVFQLNGMGRVSVESIFRREYPTVQYGVVILALVYVFVNFFVDLAYAWIDPRVRHARMLG